MYTIYGKNCGAACEAGKLLIRYIKDIKSHYKEFSQLHADANEVICISLCNWLYL